MRTSALALLLSVVACDAIAFFPPEGGISIGRVELSTDQASYGGGGEVTLALRNGSDTTVETGVLACALLERRTDAGWTSDLSFNERACIAIAVSIAPGDTYSETQRLDGVRGGTYRFMQRTSVGELVTATFDVR